MTNRAEEISEYINKRVTIQCTFAKYGKQSGTDMKVTCLSNVKIIGSELTIDHVWTDNKKFVDLTLRPGNKLTFKAIIRKRNRPSDSIYDEPTIDVRLSKVKEITFRRTEK